MTQRIDAALRIQKNWRGVLTRNTVGQQAAAVRDGRAAMLHAADCEEAALLIQGRARIVAAKRRVAGLKEERDERARKAAVAVTYVHPDRLDQRLFTFRGIPDDDDVMRLFDAIDTCSSGTIPRPPLIHIPLPTRPLSLSYAAFCF